MEPWCPKSIWCRKVSNDELFIQILWCWKRVCYICFVGGFKHHPKGLRMMGNQHVLVIFGRTNSKPSFAISERFAKQRHTSEIAISIAFWWQNAPYVCSPQAILSPSCDRSASLATTAMRELVHVQGGRSPRGSWLLNTQPVIQYFSDLGTFDRCRWFFKKCTAFVIWSLM